MFIFFQCVRGHIQCVRGPYTVYLWSISGVSVVIHSPSVVIHSPSVVIHSLSVVCPWCVCGHTSPYRWAVQKRTHFPTRKNHNLTSYVLAYFPTDCGDHLTKSSVRGTSITWSIIPCGHTVQKRTHFLTRKNPIPPFFNFSISPNHVFSEHFGPTPVIQKVKHPHTSVMSAILLTCNFLRVLSDPHPSNHIIWVGVFSAGLGSRLLV